MSIANAPMSRRFHRGFLVTAALIGATLMPGFASAQNRNCATHEDVMMRLAEGYGETRQAIALGADNTVIEIYASLETGTWTITVTMPGGPTCLVSAGEAYQPMLEDLPIIDSGA